MKISNSKVFVTSNNSLAQDEPDNGSLNQGSRMHFLTVMRGKHGRHVSVSRPARNWVYACSDATASHKLQYISLHLACCMDTFLDAGLIFLIRDYTIIYN